MFKILNWIIMIETILNRRAIAGEKIMLS